MLKISGFRFDNTVVAAIIEGADVDHDGVIDVSIPSITNSS